MKHQIEAEELAEAFRLSMRETLDEKRTYHPVFCAATVSDAVSAIKMMSVYKSA